MVLMNEDFFLESPQLKKKFVILISGFVFIPDRNL